MNQFDREAEAERLSHELAIAARQEMVYDKAQFALGKWHYVAPGRGECFRETSELVGNAVRELQDAMRRKRDECRERINALSQELVSLTIHSLKEPQEKEEL